MRCLICLPDIVLGTHSPYVYVPSVLLAGLAGWLACNGGEAGDDHLSLCLFGVSKWPFAVLI